MNTNKMKNFTPFYPSEGSTEIVIKGAFYYDFKSEKILMPLVTSEGFFVDCIEYLPKKSNIEKLGKDFFERNKKDFVTYNDKKYYYAKVNVNYINRNLKLLSDLSALSFIEEEREF